MTVAARRAARVVIALAATLALRGEAGAADPARCVRAARTDRSTCMRDAVERCTSSFETSLQTCFGPGNTCVRTCIADHDRCKDSPQTAQQRCRLTCRSDQKDELGRCKLDPDKKSCEETAKSKGNECTQRCVAASGPSKQRCADTFNACLNALAS